MREAGLVPKSLLKVRLRCKASHAEERKAFHSTHASNSASAASAKSSKLQSPENSPKKLGEDKIRPSVYSPAQPFAPQHRSAPPQNQLHLAECNCRKSCMEGCGVLSGVGG